MEKSEKSKVFDLEGRTLKFAADVRAFIRKLPQTIANREDIKQLVRSSGSVAANYIEANEALGKKDFGMRIRIARKEAKESRLWLKLLDCGEQASYKDEFARLIQEASEFILIFTSILKKVV